MSRGATAALAAGGRLSMPRPSATRWAEVIVDVAQVPDHALAHVSVSTLDSSNTSAEAMCACSGFWLRKNMRAWL
jgi:hypothetical protein